MIKKVFSKLNTLERVALVVSVLFESMAANGSR